MVYRKLILASVAVAALLGHTDYAQAQCSGQPSANTICAGPASGGAGLPSFRASVTGDLPATVGTVKSVAATVPPTFLTVTGSPITASGTLGFGLVNSPADSYWGAKAAGAPGYLAFPTCNLANQALNYTPTTGFTCATVSGGGGGSNPGPPNNAVQFNQGGVFGGSATFTYVAPLLTINNNAATTPASGPGGTQFQSVGADNQNVYFTLDVFGNGTGVTPSFAGRHYGGTGAALAATGSGESLFNFGGYGYDGTATAQGGTMAIFTAQPWATGAHGTRVSFFTTPNNGTTRTEAVRVQPSGGLSIGSPYADPGIGGLNFTGVFQVNGNTMTFPAGPATLVSLSGNNAFTGNNTFSGINNFTSTFQINGNTMTFPSNAAILVQGVSSGTVTIPTGTYTNGTCTALTVTGSQASILSTDVLQASFSGDPTVAGGGFVAPNMLAIVDWVGNAVVGFKACNNTNQPITTTVATTINWRVSR
jgi:hypothetical protein